MHRILLSLIPILAATIPLIITETSVVAHHAFSAEFDASRPVALRGNITKMEWINPHAWMHLDVTNDDGTVDSWMIEAGPPGALVARAAALYAGRSARSAGLIEFLAGLLDRPAAADVPAALLLAARAAPQEAAR